MNAIVPPAPRYRPGLALLAGSIGISVILGVLVSPGGASPRTETSSVAEPRRIGMNSCAARGCHGAVESVDPAKGDVYIKDGAYTTWLNFDPHARAYEILLEPRSIAIADKLKDSLKNEPAHKAELCLACHSTTSPPEPISDKVALLRDGIDCEACHGGAEVWNDKHVAASWRALPADKKALDGMNDLSTPRARAENCVECHVGLRSRGMDMNHDLIAAGHPRLNFEFASYQAAYPKHWKEKPYKANDFEAKSWAIGQVVTARAVLQLLADRAEASKVGAKRTPPAPKAIWPEFSEYECFSCHHDLIKNGPLQNVGHVQGRPGKLPWATWPMAMLPDLAGIEKVDLVSLAKLKIEMEKAVPDEDEVVRLARSAISELDKLVAALEQGVLDPARLTPLLKRLAASKPNPAESWDVATQMYLARSSVARSGLAAQVKQLGIPSEPFDKKPLEDSFELLKFPEQPTVYDSPRSVSP
jgi:Cytochrome c554 and c-prime